MARSLARVPARVVFALALGVSAAYPAAADGPPRPLRLGVIAEEPNEPGRLFRVYARLIQTLRERLAPKGVALGTLVVTRDLDDLSRRLVRGDVELVFESVFPTVSLRELSRNLDPALVVVRRGQREYHSVFFTRQESPIRTLQDLRGKTLVLQAPRSTSAFAVPRDALARAGLTLASADDAGAAPRTVRYVLGDAEVNQAVWVLHGRGDAGAFSNGDWLALPEKVRAELRIFHETQPFLRGLVSFRADLDAGTRLDAEEVLLALHKDQVGQAALGEASGITRLERLTPRDRSSLRVWARRLLAKPR